MYTTTQNTRTKYKYDIYKHTLNNMYNVYCNSSLPSSISVVSLLSSSRTNEYCTCFFLHDLMAYMTLTTQPIAVNPKPYNTMGGVLSAQSVCLIHSCSYAHGL
eukprot:665175_1